MKQKTIWIPYIIFGIISSLTATGFNSCKRVDPVKTVNYIYKNQTEVDLLMEIYNSECVLINSFNIQNNNEVETNTTTFEVPALFYFEGAGNQVGDSIVVKFSDNKCLNFSKSISSKIFQIKEYDNYSDELMNESKFTLYFTFTIADYNNSVVCD